MNIVAQMAKPILIFKYVLPVSRVITCVAPLKIYFSFISLIKASFAIYLKEKYLNPSHNSLSNRL